MKRRDLIYAGMGAAAVYGPAKAQSAVDIARWHAIAEGAHTATREA